MVTASQWTTGQVVMIWLLAFVVGVGKFSHCIASSGEILAALVAWIGLTGRLLPVAALCHLGEHSGRRGYGQPAELWAGTLKLRGIAPLPSAELDWLASDRGRRRLADLRSQEDF
jgi:formate-nitrite transporter family protein